MIKIQKAMLRKETNFLMLILISMICFSCMDKPDLTKIELDEYVVQNSLKNKELRKQLQSHYEKLVLEEQDVVSPMLLFCSWEIDPVMYISQDNRRMYTHYFIKKQEKVNARSDISQEIVGMQQNGKWYFLEGAVTYTQRSAYKSDSKIPFTFEEMSYLANRNLFKRIVSHRNGEYKVSKDFFANRLKELDHSNPKGDSIFLARVNKYTPKRANVERIRKNRIRMQNEKPREMDKESLFQKIFGEPKVFDSKEWKKRRLEVVK